MKCSYEIIATGSTGNAVVIESYILIDCGVSFKCYESRFTYEELCRFLDLKFEQARDIYDGVSALLLEDVGVFKEQESKLPQKGGRKPKVLPKAPPRPLEYLPTGTDWRKA